MTIYKMYDGRHIDLSKIIAVGPINMTPRGEETDSFSHRDDAHFDVWFQLVDKPLRFDVPGLTPEEEKKCWAIAKEAYASGTKPFPARRAHVRACKDLHLHELRMGRDKLLLMLGKKPGEA